MKKTVWLLMWLTFQVSAQDLNAPAAAVSVEPQLLPEVSREHQVALEQMARFTLALEQIRRLHAGSGAEVDYETLIDNAIAGMMSKLDRHSSYLDTKDAQSMKAESQGVFGGIGVVISLVNNGIAVVSPIEDSPGWTAGLLARDVIVDIDGTPTRGMTVEAASALLRGDPGTEVKLKVRRPGENKVLEFALTRAIIETRPVQRHRVLTEEIGYIRVNSFAQNTAALLREEMTALNKRNMRGLVLDLRGNPGGLLESAVEVAGLFLPKGTLVVFTKGREAEGRKDYLTHTRSHRFQPALVILVNEGSASASEVVSGALRDHQRAKLVGKKTFGKASVQSILPLPDGSALRLTTATYFTPSEKEIHEKGIVPDVEVSLPMRLWRELQEAPAEGWEWKNDPQLLKAVELLQEALAKPAAEG
jgi:carboxyl-terminal processing protease